MVKRATTHLATMFSALLLSTATEALIAEESVPMAQKSPAQQESAAILQPFTGKVIGTKVRVRLEPSVDSPILDELAADDMVVVLGEHNGFYAIRPPARVKAFVYRTYIIDDIVEGNHVNVRSEPHLDAPVLVQLNKGDRVDGHVSPINNKWLQIALPNTVRFYVANDYIEHAGDVDLMDRLDRRQREASGKVDEAHLFCQSELAKPFEEIDLGKACQDLENVIVDFADIPEQCQRAQRFLSDNHEVYSRKKIDYLQQQAAHASEAWNDRCKDLAKQMAAQQSNLEVMEQCLRTRTTEQLASTTSIKPHQPQKQSDAAPVAESQSVHSMTPWMLQEANLFDRWLQSHPNASLEDFYSEQGLMNLKLRGSVQPYLRPLKTKPGNFVLLDQVDEIPVAFLYSTKVDLDSVIGQPVTLKVAPRPNNNYAFPAYFVLDVVGTE